MTNDNGPVIVPDPAREAGEKAFDVVWRLVTLEVAPDLAKRYGDDLAGNLLLNLAINCVSWLVRLGVDPGLIGEHLDKALQAGLDARDADGHPPQH